MDSCILCGESEYIHEVVFEDESMPVFTRVCGSCLSEFGKEYQVLSIGPEDA